MKQQSLVKDIDESISNKNKPIQIQNNEFYQQAQQEVSCKDKMKKKFNEFIDIAANFLECVRLFDDEKLEELQKNAINDRNSESESVVSEHSQDIDDPNNISKMSTKEDMKGSVKDKQMQGDDRELPAKSYSMNQPLRFNKKYAEVYDLSYSERKKKFGYTFEEVQQERQNQQMLKSKTFWEELKRFIFCRGGNYLDQLEMAEKQTNAVSQKGSRPNSRKNRRQPSLGNSNIKSHDNVFLIDEPSLNQNQFQQIKLNRYGTKKATPNITSQSLQNKTYKNQTEFQQQQKKERTKKRRSVQTSQVVKNSHAKSGKLNVNQQIIQQNIQDIPVQNLQTNTGRKKTQPAQYHHQQNQNYNNQNNNNYQVNFNNMNNFEVENTNNYNNNNNFNNYESNNYQNNNYNNNYENNNNYNNNNNNYDNNNNYNNNIYDNNMVNNSHNFNQIPNNNDYNNNTNVNTNNQINNRYIVNFQDHNDSTPVPPTVQQVYDYSMQFQVKLNDEANENDSPNKQGKLQRRKKNKRQSKNVVIKDNNQESFNIDQL